MSINGDIDFDVPFDFEKTLQSFRNLLVWRKASRGANLAEGCVRRTPREFGRFVGIALGSASELEYHLLLAFDLELLTSDDHKQFDCSVREVKRMLVGLNRKLMAEN
ncbi:MAG: four helix bundle protein [Gemmatimonadales bacterium]